MQPMRIRRFGLVMLLGLCSALHGGEPQKTDDTILLWNFGSLTDPDFMDGRAEVQSHGATLDEGRWGTGLRVKPGRYLTILPEDKSVPERGTVMFWFRPNWSSATDSSSHSLLSWGWQDGKDGYGVLSNGWWEPAGAGRTYLVFENQLYAHCSQPVTYTANEWMHFAFTWSFDKRLVVSLYLNGERISTTTGRPYETVPSLRTAIHIGTDKGTSMARDRWTDGTFDGLHVFGRALTKSEIRDAFRAQEPKWREVERKRDAWLYDVLKQPYAPKRDAQGRILESRALLDEWSRWATRQGAEDAVNKLTDAGFNVYIPCVWHGRGARWPSERTPMETAVENLVKGEGEGFDPLANMIRLCHEKGIEVHPWFCVCYGDKRWKPLQPFIEDGTPNGACEAHNPAFRKFIIDLMMEVVKTYDVDGLNLDYIRTKGMSKSETAKAAYRKRFGTELLDDLAKPRPNGWPNANIVTFQDEAIADIVRSVSAQARAAKPGIVISSDGHPYLPTDRPGTQGRNGFWWAKEGWVDIIYCMDYGRTLSWPKAEAIRKALKRPSAYVTIAGNYERGDDGRVASIDGQRVADLIAFCQRKYPGNGVALYWLGSLDDAQSKALREGPFKEPAKPHWIRASDAQPRRTGR